ncbi:uncharacterized protein LOC113567437 [Drosophila persimilis]|uniref:uncharacterized protein LOC113567437 n=1 Tax=Drosophila persimilis TaxID=7234 RepID=UPI000F07CA61|nr:uncharacterized protein LOC113567437 [Drosophila persimilis]
MSGLFFYVIFAFIAAVANGQKELIPEYLRSMECGQCDAQQDCRIETTGSFCPSQYDRIELHYSHDGNLSAGLDSLAECLPKHYYFINKKAISQMCCFWTPQTGCQQLRSKSYNRNPCSVCAKWNWNTESDPMGCPCHEIEEHSRKKRKGRKGGATKLQHFGLFPVIFIYFVQQIFSPLALCGREM